MLLPEGLCAVCQPPCRWQGCSTQRREFFLRPCANRWQPAPLLLQSHWLCSLSLSAADTRVSRPSCHPSISSCCLYPHVHCRPVSMFIHPCRACNAVLALSRTLSLFAACWKSIYLNGRRKDETIEIFFNGQLRYRNRADNGSTTYINIKMLNEWFKIPICFV